MRRSVNQLVAVYWVFMPEAEHPVYPKYVFWKGKWQPILFWGFKHHYGHDKLLRHIFEVCSDAHFFRLNLNPISLTWTLEVVADG